MSSDTNKKAEDILKKASLRKTAPRVAVLEVLINSAAAITQEHITERLSDSAPNKVTIYRVLECLMEKDIVHKAYMKDRTAFYELGHNCSNNQCHPHFTCTSCRKTICMKNVRLPMAKIPDPGFDITHQKVELRGTCPDCKNKS